ncbi:hypothetical protein ACFL5I_01220 [Planctomycetota bacterium]
MKKLFWTIVLCLGIHITGGLTPLAGQTEPLDNELQPITTTPVLPEPTTITKPPTVILKPFHWMLEKVQDRTPLKQNMAYNTLLSYMAKLLPGEISQKSNSRISYKDLLLTPERYRGEIVRAEGRLTYLRPYDIDTNPAGIKTIYAGMIDSTTTDEYFKFHIIKPPQESLITYENEKGIPDEVSIEGVFLKIERYSLAKPKYDQLESYAPFLIGQTIKKIEIISLRNSNQFKIVLGIIIGIAFIILILLVVLSARREKSLRQRVKGTSKKNL